VFTFPLQKFSSKQVRFNKLYQNKQFTK